MHRIKALQRGNTKLRSGNIIGNSNPFQGRLQGLWSDQSLVNTGVSKTVYYGMEEFIGSIQPYAANSANDLSNGITSKFVTLQAFATRKYLQIMPSSQP